MNYRNPLQLTRSIILYSLIIAGLSALPLRAESTAAVAARDSLRLAAYTDTLQWRYAELIRIIGASSDSVISRIKEIDTGYTSKLTAIHDSLFSLFPANTSNNYRDSLTCAYSGLHNALLQNGNVWTETVKHFRESVTPVIVAEKNKLRYSDDASAEDYSFGMSLFNNFADSIYQSVKDTIADYSDNAGASMNNLFVSYRDSLQSLSAGLLFSGGQTDNALTPEIAATPSPFSLYASFSSRYDRNPLCNYQKLGDLLWQSYHEFKYLVPVSTNLLSVKYIGGLTLFNSLAERNYYESMLTGKYRIPFSQHESAISDDAADDRFEKFSSLNISVSASARFDKHFYKDYDNHGLVLAISFKKPVTDSLFFYVRNTACLRKYETSSELSNAMELISAGVSGKLDGNFTYDFSLQGGIKEYFETLIDTLITGYTNNNTAQPVYSFTAQPKRTYHSSLNFRLMKSWETSSLQLTMGYTTNFNSKARFLRKNIDKPRLTEDLYYDYFSYTGEDARIEYQTPIPFDIRMNVGAELHVNELYLPAFTLSGIKTAENRHDILSSLSATFSRYFDSGLGFGYELNLSGGYTRRMSKDEYNDFSSYYTSAGVSIGL